MEATIKIRKAIRGWTWYDDGINRDMFSITATALDRLARGRKGALVFFSTTDFYKAKKLVYSHIGQWRTLTYAVYKSKGFTIRLCQEWLNDSLGGMRRTLYVKIMWL